MQKSLFLFLGLFILCLVAAGCTRSQSAQGISSDSDIKNAVEEHLKMDPKVDLKNINVDVDDGVVTLKGEVKSQEEIARAVDVAGAVPKVVRVNSELTVKNVVTNKDVEKHVEENQEVAKEKLEKNEGHETLGQEAKDAEITTKVKLAFAKDPNVSALQIDVDTDNGVVTLTGTVKSEAEAQQAIELAKSIEGVHKVTSVLTVKS